MTSRLAVLAVTASLLAPAAAGAQTTEHTLSVLGHGQIEMKPDRGSFSVGVSRRSASQNAVRRRVNARISAIVRGLRALGIPGARIRTSAISIDRFGRRQGKHGPVRVRYRASVSLDVDVEGLALLGRAIDVASRRGASNVYGPQLGFSPERRARGRQAAEAAALQDARTRAEAVAAAEGQRITGIQSINLDPSQADLVSFAPLSSASDGGGSAGRTRVLGGRRRVTTDVRVTYLIEPTPSAG